MASGRRVELVAMIEPLSLNTRTSFRFAAGALERILKLITSDPERRKDQVGLAMLFIWRVIRYVNWHLRERWNKTNDEVESLAVKIAETDRKLAVRYYYLMREYLRVMAAYIPAPLAAEILYFITESHIQNVVYASHMWNKLTPRLEIDVVPGDHLTCITTHAESLVKPLRARLLALDREGDQD
jgi:hypothetical protein